jgi:hypothetical protein
MNKGRLGQDQGLVREGWLVQDQGEVRAGPEDQYTHNRYVHFKISVFGISY